MRKEPRVLPALQLTEDTLDAQTHVIALSGELGLSSVGELQTALESLSAAELPQVCLDLTELQFIDSSGLAMVVRAQTKIVEAGGALAIVCVTGPVQRTLTMTGLLDMLTVGDSREAALHALAHAA